MSPSMVRLGAVALLALTTPDLRLQAQLHDRGAVGVQLIPEPASRRQSVFPVSFSYRMYSESETLRLAVDFLNLSDIDVEVNQEALQKAIRIRLLQSQDIPVMIEWLPEVQVAGERTPGPNAAVALLVKSQTTVRWWVDLKRLDGVFTRGNYVLEYDGTRVASAVRKGDTTSWAGQAAAQPGRLEILIATPSTPRERAEMHLVAGHSAFARGALAEAAEAYAQAVGAERTDPNTKMHLANTWLILNRYADALPLYQELVTVLKRGAPEVGFLVRAYLGVGDEESARRVLRASGIVEQEIGAQISQLRQMNNARR